MSKKPPLPSELKELEKIWYQKLKETGFHDIEDTHHPHRPLKNYEDAYFKSVYPKEVFLSRLEYYQLCSRFLHLHSFSNEQDKLLWELHTEGVALRKITLLFHERGFRMNKDKARKKIRELLNMMKEALQDDSF